MTHIILAAFATVEDVKDTDRSFRHDDSHGQEAILVEYP